MNIGILKLNIIDYQLSLLILLVLEHLLKALYLIRYVLIRFLISNFYKNNFNYGS